MEKIQILWTGGWDSTFRIIELSQQNVEIEPIYVIDPNRKSTEYELKAMSEIIKQLEEKKETKAKFLRINKIKLEEIIPDIEISEAYKKINKETGLGSQHEWLAWLGKTMPGMEMGTEAGTPDTSHIINAINNFGSLEFDSEIGYLNKERSSKEGILVLGWFRFPIIKKTEEDMLKIVKQQGYEDVMKNVWFCHNPIDGEPCGLCHPCDVKMESKMEWLLSEKAQKRYKIHKNLEKKYGKKFGYLCSKIIRKLV